MDPFKKRVIGMIVSHLQTIHKQTDLRVDVVPMGSECVLLRVWEPTSDSNVRNIRRFSVQISEVKG